MSDPFISEIRLFGFNYAPKHWATCNGQIIPITQNQSLYALIGTTYGGDGRNNFALPNLCGRAPMHRSDSMTQGYPYGQENVSLTASQTPAHTHNIMAAETGSTNEPHNNVLGQPSDVSQYADPSNPSIPMNPNSVAHAGANQGHNNMQPSLVINFCISLLGTWPSRT